MIHYKRILFASFTAGAALLCASALADTTNPTPTAPAPNTTLHNQKKLECRFEGGGSGKSGGWFESCRAEGEFGEHDGMLSDDEDHLKLKCNDPDDVDDIETIFDGRMDVKYLNGIAIFRGIDDDRAQDTMDDGDDDSCGPPVITVNLRGDEDQSTYDDDDRSKPAELTFSDDGFSFDLTGRCRIEDETPPPPPSMN